MLAFILKLFYKNIVYKNMEELIGKKAKFTSTPASIWYGILGYYRGPGNIDYFILRSSVDYGDNKCVIHQPVMDLTELY